MSSQPRAILPMPLVGQEDTPMPIVDVQSTTKRSRKNSSVTPTVERPYAPRASALADGPIDPPPPAKRGRKPGPLSKSAREAQRRLNHSIIEKARRTKINDALATLKTLVPSDYLQNKQKEAEDMTDDEDEDQDYDNSSKKAKPKGKKEEKEFKLEILERTVAFLQDLLVKVDGLEKNAPAVCSNCGGDSQTSKKRKRPQDDDPYQTEEPRTKVARYEFCSPPIRSFPEGALSIGSTTPAAISRGSSTSPNIVPTGGGRGERERLPSISSWLPSTAEIDPQLLPPPLIKRRPSGSLSSYLPSPPSSTHFDPIRSSGSVPPTLNLGPVATSSSMPSPPRPGPGHGANKSPSQSNNASRTPEDESAATMLLQIATSPLFRPLSSSLPDPSTISLHSDMRSQAKEVDLSKLAQTPSSILGIRKF